MFRTLVARFAFLASSLFIAGCASSRNNCCTDDRPGFFSRFRLCNQKNTHPVVVANGDCCGDVTGGPILPGGNVLPPPATNVQPNIPRIDENGKQMPWDPKTGRTGTKTGNEVKATKEGT
jgi:hypothetical protein